MLFQFTVNDIKSILNKLDPDKTHGHDMISVSMVKLCGDSFRNPLEIIFKTYLNQEFLKQNGKKPVYKIGDYQYLKKIYKPVSFLPVFSKIFEKLIYEAIFKQFLDNNLFPFNQLGFKPDSSCIKQLIPISDDNFKVFDNGLVVSGVFHDIYKASYKV